jgi:inner membrane protein
MIAGLALGMSELAMGSFFILWFGLGAIVVGLAMLALPTLPFNAQVGLWTLASVAFTVLWFKVLRKQGGDLLAGQADASLGEIGVLVRAVEPFKRSEVRFQKPLMGSETWPCIAEEALAAGERVQVLAVDGQLLRVGKSSR